MSWGERSCTGRKCKGATYENCNVDCSNYEWDSKTQPDSKTNKNKMNLGSILKRQFQWVFKSKYLPHQGKQEIAKRKRQIEKGTRRTTEWDREHKYCKEDK